VSREPSVRLLDIKEALERVQRLTSDLDFAAFVADEAAYYAVVFSLGVAGEAAKSLPTEILKGSTTVDWRAIGRLRDILFHAYFGISSEVVWKIVSESVPATLTEVNRLIESEKS
jgi:uncharacterized protein with HEPN domain